MHKRVASAFFLGLFSLIFPVFLVLEFFYSYVWPNLIFSERREIREGPIQAFWVKPCEKIINWGWKKEFTEKALARVLRNHDIRVDYVWSDAESRNFHDHHYKERYACWTEGCNMAVLTQSANMTYREWQAAIFRFRSEHPCFKVKSSGLPKKF